MTALQERISRTLLTFIWWVYALVLGGPFIFQRLLDLEIERRSTRFGGMNEEQ